MTPAEYLVTIVLPTYAELMEAPDDPRRAYLACITAAHLVDYVHHATRMDKREVRHWITAYGDFARDGLAIVEGISNGTKHAEPEHRGSFKFAPGSERRHQAFAFDTEGAGFEEGRWSNPGLSVEHRGARFFIDDCVRGTVWAFAEVFPTLFNGADLAVTRPGFDRWGKPQ